MPLTRDFRETIQARAQRDPEYRRQLLREAVEVLISGDIETGKSLLRDYINAAVGFEELAKTTRIPAKSLMRMLGPGGNPQARNLLDIIRKLQEYEKIRLTAAISRRQPA